MTDELKLEDILDLFEPTASSPRVSSPPGEIGGVCASETRGKAAVPLYQTKCRYFARTGFNGTPDCVKKNLKEITGIANSGARWKRWVASCQNCNEFVRGGVK